MTFAFQVLEQILITLWHTFPWLLGMGLVFGVLSRLMPCSGTEQRRLPPSRPAPDTLAAPTVG
jgi:hypothetical protein